MKVFFFFILLAGAAVARPPKSPERSHKNDGSFWDALVDIIQAHSDQEDGQGQENPTSGENSIRPMEPENLPVNSVRRIPKALGDMSSALENLRQEHQDVLQSLRQVSTPSSDGRLRSWSDHGLNDHGISGSTIIGSAKTNIKEPRFYQSIADATFRNAEKITKLEFYLESVIDEMYDNFKAIDNRVTAVLQTEIEPLKLRTTTAEVKIATVETALGNFQAATDIAMREVNAGIDQVQSEVDTGMQNVRSDIHKQIDATKEVRPRPTKGSGGGTSSIF